MGNYNPNAPYILGEEWVPIRDENATFSPAVNALELGHGFTLGTSRTLQDARFYVNTLPQGGVAAGQVFMAAVYPRGQEDQTGPIRSVVIPCESGALIGAGAAFVNATTVQEALFDPSDQKRIEINSAGPGSVTLFFSTGQYSNILVNKRIVGANLLYGIGDNSADGSGSANLYLTNDATYALIAAGVPYGGGVANGSSSWGSASFPIDLQIGPTLPVHSVAIGEIDHFWSTASDPWSIVERLPFTLDSLLRFQSGAASRKFFLFNCFNGNNLEINYVALEVLYCEEKRLAYGGVTFGYEDSPYGTSVNIDRSYVPGANIIPMRSVPGQTLNPVLAAGDYSLVVSSANVGNLAQIALYPGAVAETSYPLLNAVRELYAIAPHPGVEVDIPFPVEDHIGDTFTSTLTHVLPQLSLHASGGTLTEPHVYGRQVAAQVYDTNTAIQDIYDDISGTSAIYPQVRYYARRFGDTTVPLTLTGVGGLSASTVFIPVDEFDELVEIVDGWKEVTLRFGTAPTMGAVAGFPQWTWSATTETSGNRWEILGACAPALSGIPGNYYNLVPSPNELTAATYQVTGGATASLTWMPQGIGSPWVSGASADAASDAVLIFSMDPPAVTGLSLSQRTQTVTGLGLNCGSLACCIPSGISYNHLSWGVAQTPFQTICDPFSVDAVDSWGTPPVGPGAWTTSGSTANKYQVAGGVATHLLDSVNVSRKTTVGSLTDVYMESDVSISAVATGSAIEAGLMPRFIDASNYYQVDLSFDIDASVTLKLRSRVAGTATGIGTIKLGAYAAGDTWRLKTLLQTLPTRDRWELLARAYVIADSDGDVDVSQDPGFWQISAVSSTLAGPAAVGARSILTLGNTNTSVTATYDNFYATVPSMAGYELQRYDTTTAAWQTIAQTASAALASFEDYEARVGIDSVYRMRTINSLNFAGPWSTCVTGAPAAPGVTGGCSDMTGALIFTSNGAQSGVYNAAYITQWDSSDVVEDYALPEAGDVVFQPMYNRDGSVAFHGTERGLEVFSRQVLVQAGAVSPVRLANVRMLRDLAWADLPYVCVRDHLGNRWYANVRVPAINVRNVQTSYMARVDITELTTTAYPVDPTS